MSHRKLAPTVVCQLFGIYDKVADTIVGQLFQERGAPVAIRNFHDLLSNPQTVLSKHPDDFELLALGTLFSNGDLMPEEPSIIATGAAWRAAQTEAAS